MKTAIWKKLYAKRERNCGHGGNNWKKKMLELSVEHRREVQNVKDLEGLTMTSILSSLSGTKQKNFEKEQKEAEEAALRLEEAKGVLEQVEKELQSVDSEVRRLRGSKEKYETALKEKAAQMEAAGVQTGFSDLEEKLGKLETEFIEVSDVLQLGYALRSQLQGIMDILRSCKLGMGGFAWWRSCYRCTETGSDGAGQKSVGGAGYDSGIFSEEIPGGTCCQQNLLRRMGI